MAGLRANEGLRRDGARVERFIQQVSAGSEPVPTDDVRTPHVPSPTTQPGGSINEPTKDLARELEATASVLEAAHVMRRAMGVADGSPQALRFERNLRGVVDMDGRLAGLLGGRVEVPEADVLSRRSSREASGWRAAACTALCLAVGV